MKRIPTVFTSLLIAGSAMMCSSCNQSEISEKPASVPAVDQSEVHADRQPAATEENVGSVDGQAIYERNCQLCHSMQPPSEAAPPIIGLASRYRQVFGNRDEAVSAMVSFMKAPSAEKSSLGPNAVNRFGLMPAMTLEDEELGSVAAWLWDQYDPEFDTGQCR